MNEEVACLLSWYSHRLKWTLCRYENSSYFYEIATLRSQ